MKNNLLREILIMSKPLFNVIFLQVLFAGMLHAGAGVAQHKSLYEIDINLKVEDADIMAIFKEIEHETDFVFTYNNKFVRNKKITISSSANLGSVLEEISKKANVQFKRINEHIHVDKNQRSKNGVLESFGTPADMTITGQVTDENGEGLPGATVAVKNSSIGTITDIDGSFTVKVPEDAQTLVFSFVGYQTQEIAFTGQTSFNIQLKLDYTSLQEVVVVGYGEQKKADLTGAVSVVKTEEVQKRQATTVAEAMQGLATGVNIRGGGQPGSEAQIQIRGLSNFSGQPPLYVIDGMITTANRDFNPNDIESIQILKDASAAAIYGSRAANGVIIITTKKGKEGPLQVKFSGKTGVQQMPRYDLADRDEYIEINNMAYDNAGVPRQDHDMTNDTDWQDETFQTGRIQDYNLSFSGGGPNGTYLISGNYFENKGTVISTGFERLSFRVNTSAKKGIFSVGENLAITNAQADEMSGNPIIDVVRLMPTIPVYDENNPGGYGYGNEARARTFGTNPVALADYSDRMNENFRIRGNFWSEIKPVDFLTYRLNVGYNTSFDHYQFLRKEGNWTLNQPYEPAIAIENRGTSSTLLVENTLNFDKDFGKHSLNVLLGQTYQDDKYERIEGTKRNLPQNPSTGEYYTVLDQGDQAVVTGFRQQAVLISYLGRLSYTYDDKYIFSAIFRRDGTSRLSPDNRWSTFPSVAAGWRVSDEAFFNSSLISNLKLRANHGTLGSANIGYWDYQQRINTFPTIAIGADQHIEGAATNVQLANNNLRWETLTQSNFGVDLGFFDDKLTATAEYYISTTDDVLTQAPIAITTGNDGGNPFVNAASLRNTGFEFTISYAEAAKEFKYNTSLNITTIKNEVLSLGYDRNDIYVGNTVTEVGNPIGMWYVLETDGLFQGPDDVLNYQNDEGQVIQPTAQPGDIRFVDHNGDGQITNDDKVVMGSPWADVELGWNFNASYKNFEFSMTWFSSLGATVYSATNSVMGRFDDNSNYQAGTKPWTEENPNTETPRAYYGTTLNSRGDTDRWLESGNFARMKFISLAYNLPIGFLEKVGFQTAQVSISGQNLITLTKYSGLDPEFRGPTIYERGFDLGAFPNVKTMSVGLNFGF
ncbi:SusC/RagA family TonB-linked outer membrane protein [Marinoscillum pacificum]|uniref:SusC/RagA family TonB-linked outer membrane protein n=1 Tax=Marinoscillum pacificum TaxID=392723 RepID=UPI00215895DD|nr:TonB-dependent receptor [Marinoscillum pacificum]